MPISASRLFSGRAQFIVFKRFDRRIELESEIAELKTDNAKLEALLDQALKTLHHERFLHFDTTSDDMEGMK